MEDFSNCKSVLRMEELYFSEINFKIEKRETQDIMVGFGVKFRKENDTQVVILRTMVNPDNQSFKLMVELVGKFKLVNDDNLVDDIKEQLLTVNTVSMLFPYMRSQVSLLTTQPGLQPLLLQPINVNKFVQDEIAHGAKEY